MLFRRFPCAPLAQNAYVVGVDGEALVVDPMRDADDLLAFVAAQRLRVRHVVATHVHADFVAGVAEVAAATGAPVAIGARCRSSLPGQRLDDGHALPLGGLSLQVLATPGHTEESVCLLLPATDGQAARLLTGDTLFVGDVGRPDLAQGQGDSPATMAAWLFDSVHRRLAALPDDVEVWPAHGAGSACGSCIAGPAWSTLGAERASNWALREADPERFTARLLAALAPPPPYFARVAARNRHGPPLVATLPPPAMLTVDDVGAGDQVLDVRSVRAHGLGHWPNALHVGLDEGEFEPWAGALVPADAPLVVHAADEAGARAACRRLLRVDLEPRGVVLALPPRPSVRPQIEALDLFAASGSPPYQVVDVRRPAEFAAGHVPGAVSCELRRPLALAPLAGLDRSAPTAVVCDGGYRSSAACSLLAAAGFRALHNVRDGMRGWLQQHLPVARGDGVTATS